MFAIRQPRGRSEAAVVLTITLVRDLFARDLLPQNFSGLPIEGHDYKLLRLGRLFATHTPPASAGASTRPARQRPGRAGSRPRRRQAGYGWRKADRGAAVCNHGPRSADRKSFVAANRARRDPARGLSSKRRQLRFALGADGWQTYLCLLRFTWTLLL